MCLGIAGLMRVGSRIENKYSLDQIYKVCKKIKLNHKHKLIEGANSELTRN